MPLVLSERHGAVLRVTLNRPDRLNAWTAELQEQLFARLAEADADPELRAVVVTGAGRGFCAGADMGDLQETASAAQAAKPSRPATYAMTMRTPVIAAINGPTAGIGLVLALSCDVRFAAAGAKLTTAFARRGLVAEHGISWVLPRIVGHARATDLLLSGRVVLAEEAERMGLVNFVVAPDALAEAAMAYATDVASNCSPAAMASMKRQLQGDAARTLEQSVAAADALMDKSFTWPDLAEGVASFVERRPPRFPGVAAGVGAA